MKSTVLVSLAAILLAVFVSYVFVPETLNFFSLIQKADFPKTSVDSIYDSLLPENNEYEESSTEKSQVDKNIDPETKHRENGPQSKPLNLNEKDSIVEKEENSEFNDEVHTQHDLPIKQEISNLGTDDIDDSIQSLNELSNELRNENKPCSSNLISAVGYNTCLDIVVDANCLFEKLISEGYLLESFFHPNPKSKISNFKEFAQTFTSFFSKGSASEKFATNKDMFDNIIDIAKKSCSGEPFLGGNAAIMSTRLASYGCSVSLGSYVGNDLIALLPNGVRIADPKLHSSHQDVHLIVEYSKGRLFSKRRPDLLSPRANRFILTMEDGMILPLEIFHKSIDTKRTKLIILSGFHHLEDKKEEERLNYFNNIRNFLSTIPKGSISHAEIASMSNENLVNQILNELIPHVSSFGANEQEISALYDVLRNKELSVSGYNQKPDIDESLTKIVYLMRKTGVSRVHMHSIAFQAVCQFHNESAKNDKNSGENFWPHPTQSLIEATLNAAKQACASEVLKKEDLQILFPKTFKLDKRSSLKLSFNPKKPINCEYFQADKKSSEFQSEILCCIVPTLVCKNPKKTVGLGDHISASALSVYV